MYQVARRFDKAAKKTGWKSLGWAVAGYNPQAQEVIDTFKKYLVDEMEFARKWLKTFPDELYLAWADVYGVPAMVGKNHHVLMRWLTPKHIYKPLLRSNVKIFELLKERRAQDPKGKNKRLFQYLNELLDEPALQKQIMQVMTIAQLSQGNKDKYESDFNKLFGEQLQFDWDKLKND